MRVGVRVGVRVRVRVRVSQGVGFWVDPGRVRGSEVRPRKATAAFGVPGVRFRRMLITAGDLIMVFVVQLKQFKDCYPQAMARNWVHEQLHGPEVHAAQVQRLGFMCVSRL